MPSTRLNLLSTFCIASFWSGFLVRANPVITGPIAAKPAPGDPAHGSAPEKMIAAKLKERNSPAAVSHGRARSARGQRPLTTTGRAAPTRPKTSIANRPRA